MFQVLVKHFPFGPDSSYVVADRRAAEDFVKRADVWWWCFPVDEDMLDGSSWRKGGAWAPAAITERDTLTPPVIVEVELGDDDDEAAEGERW